jgi:ribosomal protein S18 acetylase RimI-like enzyme
MHTEFRRAIVPAEIRRLLTFDHKVFRQYPADWFDREHWRIYESWWMIIDGRRIGCCAFECHVDFRDDILQGSENPILRGSLYIVTTGILPQFRGMGFGKLLKCWQISYAHRHDFTRIITNTRKSNKPMISLNKKVGFKVLRTTSGYYEAPSEPTVVMELRFDGRS